MKKIFNMLAFMLVTLTITAQGFEAVKDTGTEYEKIKVKLGADFAMQYQMLDQHAEVDIVPLGKGLNLPTANMNIDAELAPGIKLNLVTYLSAKHHNEAWVKGGYIVFDQLPFLKSDAIDKAMDFLTLKVGNMEVDYGDAHYRRSDNGHVTTNPFVGNLIMDAFTTAPAAELMYRNNGIIAMAAVTSGILKQDLVSFKASDSTYTTYNTVDELAFYWKAGYDKQFNDDLRLRATLSGYHNPNNHSGSLYNGDRAGSRYYLVMKPVTYSSTDVDIKSGHTSGNFGPGSLTKNNSLMANLFAQYKGFEFFGTYETMSGVNTKNIDTRFSQYAIEGLYRFGQDDQFFGGLRYNQVTDRENDIVVDRLQIGAGWFPVSSILLKVEYVNQTYNENSVFGEAGFDGMMVEAAISF
jgi:hypothetical protein